MDLDEGTIQRARRGDRTAQDVFLRRYAGPLHALLKRSGISHLEDSVQEVLAKLLVVLPQFEPTGPASLSTWVFTVAHRWLLDQRKRRHLILVPLEEAREIADPRPSADRLVEQKQATAALEAEIARLPADQRRIFVLAQIHQQPLEALARVEGVPVGTIKSRLHRARAQLLALLSPALSRAEGEGHASPRRA
jgi:RNA polymerase sigma-70 factor (ECF subfamily)